jgi:salicylate hydroxylase
MSDKHSLKTIVSCPGPPLETWKREKETIILVGDAAHAAAPHPAQGGAQVIEDAAVLGECLSRVVVG